MDWATLLRRTWAEDVLSCPRCRGCVALIELVTDEHEIRRNLARLGLPYEPVSFAPPRDPDEPSCSNSHRRTGRGPPPPHPYSPEGADPPLLDESADTPWQDDCQLPLDDDASQAPPDAWI